MLVERARAAAILDTVSSAPSLDDRRFVMESSTASAVDPAAPSRFLYHEREGVVWGDYDGDTVSLGRFIGTRDGDMLDIRFVHIGASDGTVTTGTSVSTIEPSDDGRLRLVERFVIDGAEHVSVCVEQSPSGPVSGGRGAPSRRDRLRPA